ncbi:MAG TPA: glycoside hydrolase family 19 protein [Phenylobacterium sp.]|nr:glycoside hydrolase family 19 protein [Phenylobacterium sp.]
MTLRNEAAFFANVRAGILGPTLSQDEVTGCQAILAAAEGLPISWAAYMLATAYHETKSTMQPVREAYWLTQDQADRYFFRMYDPHGARPGVAAELGNTQPGDGVRFCGRGYVQLTGRRNYQRAQNALGVHLVTNPDLAMDRAIAAKIMRRGMVEGWFTGKKLADYLPRPGFTAARRIINGTDRAGDIAIYARRFQAALLAGEWAQ